MRIFRSWTRFAALAALALAATCVTGAGAGTVLQLRRLPDPAPTRGKRVSKIDPHSVLVRFRASAAPMSRTQTLRAEGLSGDGAVPDTGFQIVATGRRAPREVAQDLRKDPAVADVELNYVRKAFGIPNDPLYPDFQQSYLDSLRLPEAWDESKGSDSGTIAILDTGVDLAHPDLAAHTLPGYDFVNHDANPQDDEGHGTMVAGIAAAITDNGHGVAGVAWNARILPVKVLDDFGEGTDADVAAGITWAADHGASVINLSLGGPDPSSALDSAITYARSKGAVVVAAAGNDAASLPEYPAASPGVIAVAATGQNGDFAWFSNYGAWVDVVAPGIDITSTFLQDGSSPPYATGSGTSFAAPMVAGAALLIRAARPADSVSDVERALERARDRGPRGIDEFYGNGFLDAYASLGGPRTRPVVPPGDANEPNGTADSATPMTTAASGTISPEGDVDWYSADLTAGGWTAVTVTPPPFGAIFRPLEMLPGIAVYAPDGQLVSKDEETGFFGDPETAYVHVKETGRYAIKVFDWVGSRSPGAYTVSISDSGPPPRYEIGFDEYEAYPGGSQPQSVAIGDVTGDGRNDVLLSTSFSGHPEDDFKLFVYEQLADGSLGDPLKLETDSTGGAVGIATGDLNGDGIDDVALATNDGVDVYDGGAGLGAPTLLAGTGGYEVFMRDMNGDGMNDLVVNAANNGFRLLLNTGDGFAATTIPTPDRLFDITLGDVTGDGRLDVVGYSTNKVYTFAQNPNGTFAPPVTYPILSISVAGASGVEVTDVTGDGLADVVLSTSGNQSAFVEVIAQTEDGGLSLPVLYSSLIGPETVMAADVNDDGLQDVATLHGGFLRLGIYQQQLDGTLADEQLFPIPYASHYQPQGLALGDFNGDQLVDIAIADYNDGLVVLRQTEPILGEGSPLWVRGAAPADFAGDVAVGASPTVRFSLPLDESTVTPTTIRLTNALTGGVVSAAVGYEAATATAVVHPAASLAAGQSYIVTVDGVKDIDGESLDAPFSFRFTTAGLDATPPETTITGGPTGTVTSHDAELAFHAAGETGDDFECSLDGSSFRVCFSPKHYAGLVDGSHTFSVRAIDAAGNSDQTPAGRTWTIAGAGPPPPPPPPPPVQPPDCVVPNVTGMMLPGASKRLRKHHCSIGSIAYGHTRRIAKGRVIAERPKAGTRLRNNGRVRLVVNAGRRRR